MGHTYSWAGGSGSLALAADWFDRTAGAPSTVVPGVGATVSLIGAAAGLLQATGALNVSTLIATFGTAVTGRVTAATLSAVGTLVVQPGARLAATTANVGGALAATGTGASVQVAGTLALSGAVVAVGGASLSIAALVLAGGTLSLDALSTAVVGGGTAAAGTLAVAAAALIAGSGALHADAGGIALAGTIAANGGALVLFGAVTGTGTLSIGAGATLFAAGAVGAGLTAAFAAPAGGAGGTLELFGAAAAFAANITGFAAGDAIDIASDAIASAVWATGTLTLTDPAGTALALALPDGAGQTYDTAAFLPVPDPFGGTDVLLAPAATVPPSGNVTDTVPAATFQLYATASAVSHLVVAGTLAVQQRFVSNTISVTGTVVAAGPSGTFAGPSASVSGLLIAIGPRATVSVKNALALSGTLAAEGGGSVVAGTVTLTGGVLTLDAASFMTLGGATAEAGRIALAAGATLAGSGEIAGSLDDAGLLLVQGGALELAVPAGGTGSIEIGTGGTLQVLAPLALPVLFDAGATLQLEVSASLATGSLSGFAAGDVIDIAGIRIDSARWAGGTLSLTSDGTVAGTLALAGTYGGKSWQTAPDGAGGTLVSIGPGGGGLPLDISGTLAVVATIAAPAATVDAGAVVAMQGGTLAVGTLEVAAGAVVSGHGTVAGMLGDAGSVVAAGGALVVAGPISGAGTIGIAATGTLFAEAGFSGATPITFQGQGGTLALFGDASAAPGPISGFAGGDGLDIAAADVLAATWTAAGTGTGTLDLTGPTGDLGSFSLVGAFTSASFVIEPDGSGGTVISLPDGAGTGNGAGNAAAAPVPCFATGTRIATPSGEVPVETLRPGDLVLTPAGPRRLRWVGRRICDLGAVPEARPVRIAAGALARLLGAPLPRRTLLLSPQHALLLRDVLVPAVALAGATGIGRATVECITYHHIGLDIHSIVFAEGVAAELFQQASASARFDAEFGERPWPGLPCAPRIEGGAALVALRRPLLPRRRLPGAVPGALRGHLERVAGGGGATRLEGWALDDTAPARPVSLDVLRNGDHIGVAVANRWRPDLDRAGLAGGRCAFELDVPGEGPVLLRRRPDGAMLPVLADATA